MRVIKYRALHANLKQWITGLPAYGEDEEITMLSVDNDTYFDIIPETLSQYTGLEDKNGKEIYEGDILRIEAWRINGEVHFASGMFKVRNRMRENFNPSLASFMVEIRCEVIGNIHTHPELLEEVK